MWTPPTGPRPANMFHKTPQKREPQRSIAYSETCREHNESVSTRQVKRAERFAANKAKQTTVRGMQSLVHRLAKLGMHAQ